MSGFEDSKLRLIKPDFDSRLTDLVLELQHLRKLQLPGTTPPYIFFQLKSIFHLLESLESARIEGNRTTIEEMVETSLGGLVEKRSFLTSPARVSGPTVYNDKTSHIGRRARYARRSLRQG